MTRFIVERIIANLIVLFLIWFVVFVLMTEFLPDPILGNLNTETSDTETEFLLERWRFFNLHLTATQQFGLYVEGVFTRGDWGPIFNPSSFVSVSIPQLYFLYFRFTVIFLAPTFILSLLFGIIFGHITGYYRGRTIDRVFYFLGYLFVAIPIVIIVSIIFGIATEQGASILFNRDRPLGYTQNIIAYLIPIVILTLSGTFGIAQSFRNEVVEILSSDYVKVARSKGISEVKLLFTHVLRNSFIPNFGVITSGFIGIFLGGSLIFERLLAIPGTTEIIIDATEESEKFIIGFSLIIPTSIAMIVSLINDISFVVLDPRIRLWNRSKQGIINRVRSRINLNDNFKIAFNKNEVEKGGQDGA